MRQRPHTVECFVGADVQTSVRTVRMMVGCGGGVGVGASVGARPAQGTATTTEEGLVQDVRMWLGCGGCSQLVRRLRTLERASLRVG